MFNNVVLTGSVGKKLGNGFRIIRNQHLKFEATKYDWHEIPCLYWSRDEDNLFCSIKEGQDVIIHGRIEMDESIGLYVLIHFLQMVEIH